MAKKTYKKLSTLAELYVESCMDCGEPVSISTWQELKGLESNEDWLRSIAKRIEELK